MSISVIIPVLNGDEYLEEVLDAVLTQEIDEPAEVLVVDSGSTDRSLEIIRASGARLIEIDKADFGHGRTRNFAAAQTSGDLIAFLTQDATPASPHWLAAYREAFSLDPKVAAAYGPHLPRADANPMMARMLLEFFAGFSPEGVPVVHRQGDLTFLSNSNSCILREAWEQIPFRDIPYSEDQAMGSDLLAAGWTKVFHPGAAALHSHDYGMVEGFKRHFDEYRGLADSIGHVEKASASGAAKIIVGSVKADAVYFKEQSFSPAKQAAWTAKSAVHHVGRVVFGALGGRADRLPPLIRTALSLERRSSGVVKRVGASPTPDPLDDVRRYWVDGPVPLVEATPLDADRQAMEIAWIVPPFGIGSGGHTTIFRMVQELERRGHSCSIWVHDPHGIEPHSGAALRQRIIDHFMPLNAPVYLGLEDWTGCDIAVATGWQTVFPALRLTNCRARAYFVQDHEPEFYPTSSESIFAEQTYGAGLHCIAASPWLAEVMREQYGAEATSFELGVDPDQYHRLDTPRRSDTVCFYARNVTPRRAVELGLLALGEVVRRKPNTRVVLFGTPHHLPTSFPYEHLGVVSADRLNRLYNEATVGLSLSLTNYSLIPQEMMGAGLPVVELAGRACESVFGGDGEVVRLAQDNPASIADTICELLDNQAQREQLAARAQKFVTSKTWISAIDGVEAALVETVHSRGRTAWQRRRPEQPADTDSRAGSLI